MFRKYWRVLVPTAILFLVLGILIGRFIVPKTETGTWLTMRLITSDSDSLYADYVDLRHHVNTQGWLHTYYECGKWIPLELVGSNNVFTTWKIPVSVKVEYPHWQKNRQWHVDFFWPDSYGDWPKDAEPGTSSRCTE